MAREKAAAHSIPVKARIFNQQKTRRVNLALLRQLAERMAGEIFPEGGVLGIHLIDAEKMADLNNEFLGHSGSTDVITFDYREGRSKGPAHGEIFISVDDAVACAPRFRTVWQAELARYMAHGILHLHGHDDHDPSARRAMKREENRWLKALSRGLDWGKLERVKNVARRK